jgi:hypothetical protein
MSRTFRRDESGRRAEDFRRLKKREKAMSHWSMLENNNSKSNNKTNRNNNHRDDFEFDTEID